MPRQFDIALCQHSLRGDDSLDALVNALEHLVERAGDADLFVLPELTFVDPFLGQEADVRETALDATDAAVVHAFVREVAREREATVVGGSYNAVDGDRVVNRCPVACPDGTLTTYDKRHLTPPERDLGKSAGTAPSPVFDHDGVGVGVLVCYDVEFPATVRALVNRGAEVLAVPSWTEADAGAERVRRCAAARAVENQAYVAQVSLVGTHPRSDVGATGRSTVFAPCDDVVGPDGTRLSLPRDERAAAVGTVDISALRESRRRATVRPYADAVESRNSSE